MPSPFTPPRPRRARVRALAALLLALPLIAPPLIAPPSIAHAQPAADPSAPVLSGQVPPTRTWPELKAETQRRADAQLYPEVGLDPSDVAAALATITSLDRDEWAAAFSRQAAIWEDAARRAGTGAAGAATAARNWQRAWRLYDFAAWPTPNSPGKAAAGPRARAAFLAYAASLSPRLEVVRIPIDGATLVGYLRLPADTSSARPAPLVLLASGLDSHKEDAAEAAAAYLPHGIGFFAIDMPGTGQNPLPAAPGSERAFSAVLDWLRTRPEIDAGRVVVQGTSWSGYWSALVGITERARLRGAVVQGGPVHFYFTPDWQRRALASKEYLFDLFAARAALYRVTTLDDFLAYGPKLSLLASDMINQPSAPMLVLNGVHDTQVPIEDLDLLMRHGSATWGWINPGGFHTGRGGGWDETRIFNEVVLPWVQQMIR